MIGARLSGAQLSAPQKWQIGPRTVGPRGLIVRGPTVRREKVANWAPQIYLPKNQKIKTHHPKCKQVCSHTLNMLPNIRNTQVRTQNVSVQISNTHPKSHNHLKKSQKYHLNHKISTPKIEMSFKISNSLSKIPDEPSQIQNNPPQSRRPHQKYNVHHPTHCNDILKKNKNILKSSKISWQIPMGSGPNSPP